MSIQNTINTTIKTIQGCAKLVKNTITATAQGIAYLFTNFPQVLKSAWEVFKCSLVLGQFLMTLAWEALKYIALHIPEIAKRLYNLTLELFKFMPEVLKFVVYTLPKLFLYDLPKSVIKHLPAIANWFTKHLPDLIAHGIGVILGVVYAPFKITFDFLFGTRNNHQPNSRSAQHRDAPLAEGILVGVVGAALVADGFRNDISEIERDMKKQNHYAPGYDRHIGMPNAITLASDELAQRAKYPSLSKPSAG